MAKLVDRFVCAREGHDPVFVVKSGNLTVLGSSTYLTSCKRCGRVYEAKVQQA